MNTPEDNKAVWSIRVSPALKKWFTEFSKDRCTDSQEEARRALADFRELHSKPNIINKQESSNG